MGNLKNNESNSLMDKFFQYSADLLCIIDKEGNLTKTNTSWEKVLGYKSTELEGRAFLEYVHSDDVFKTQEAITGLAQGKEVIDFHNLYRHRDGEYLLLQWRAFPDGQNIYASARELTQPVLPGEDLISSNSFSNLIFDTTTVGLFLAKNNKFELANPAFLELFNCTLEDIKGKPVSLFYENPDDYKKLHDLTLACFAKGKPAHHEVEIKKDDDNIIWIGFTGKALNPEKPEEGIIWMAQDITREREAINELVQSEAILQSTIRSILDGLLIVDLTGKVTYYNSQFTEIFAMPEEVLSRKNDNSFLEYAKDRLKNPDEFLRKVKEIYQSKDSTNDIIELKNDRIIERRSFPIIEKENVSGRVWIFRDITERKEYEASILKSQKLLNESQRIAQIGSWELNLTNYSLVWSDSMYFIFGLDKDKDEISHERFFKSVHPDDVEKTTDYLNHIIATGKKENLEFRIIRSDGEIRNILTTAEVIKKDNKAVNIIGINKDITDIITADKALKASEQKMQRLFDVAPIGLGITKDRKIIDLNSQLCEISGYSQKELKDSDTLILYPNTEEYERVGRIIYPEMQEKGIGKMESVWKRKDGKLIDVFVAITLIDPDHPSLGSIFTSMDITERKRNEQALKNRVLALTRPLDDAGNIEITDLFNLEDLQNIQDTFCKATGVASLITTPEGIPITKSINFTSFCNKIRSTKTGKQNCYKSHAEVGKSSPGGLNIQPCLSCGIWNAGAAINVGGIHVANWLIGQVRNEQLNEIEIFNYADKLKLDRDEYIKLYYEVPSMSLEQFQNVAEAMKSLANELAIKAYQNVQQARFISEQKETEKQLIKAKKQSEESEQKMHRIFEFAPISMGVLKDRIILDINSKVCEVTWYKKEELIGQKTKMVFPSDDEYEKVGRVMYQQLEEIGFSEFESRWIRKDGKIINVYLALTYLDPEEPSKGILFTALDITKLKETEKNLIKAKDEAELSEQRYKVLHDASFGGIFIHKEGTIIDCNQGLTNITGFTRDELIGRNAFSLIKDKFQAEVKSNAKKGLQNSFELVGLRKGGEEYPVRVDARNLPYKKGEVRCVEFRDITEQKNIEAEIVKAKERAEESEFFLKESQRIGNIGSYKMSFETGLWISTETLNNIFGIGESYKRDTDGWLEIVHPDDREMMADYFQNDVINELHAFNKEYRIIRKNDNITRWVHGVGRLLFDDKGKLTEMLGTIQDITERKLIEEERRMMNIELENRVKERTTQLYQVNKDLESFTYSVSHDLRAPIRHIDGFLHLLEKSIDCKDAKIMGYFDKLFQSSNNMSTLIDKLLQFSRLGRTELKTIHVNLSDIVKEIINRLKPDYAGRNLKWEVDSLPDVNGDPGLLKIAFENLISNAIKYTSKEEQAIIEIRETECKSDHVKIIIRDNGVGFDMAYKDKIFGVFQRLHKSEEFEGIGIGLANVKQIIEKHNGEIEPESEIGKGTTFYITLPR